MSGHFYLDILPILLFLQVKIPENDLQFIKPPPKKVKDEEDTNPNREFQCYYCGAMITGIKNVKEHMRDKHRRFHSKMYGDPRPLNCHSCGATFANEKTQSNHMCTNVDFPVQKEEGGSFECKECGKKFDRRKGYIYHVINSHKAARNFPCEECNYSVIIFKKLILTLFHTKVYIFIGQKSNVTNKTCQSTS